MTNRMYWVVKTYLWQYGNTRSQLVQAKICYVNAVNDNLSGSTFNDTKQSKSQRTLSSASSSNNANL